MFTKTFMKKEKLHEFLILRECVQYSNGGGRGIRLIAERASLLAKAKRQPRGRGFGGVAARNRRLRRNPSSVATKNPTIFVGFFMAEEEGFEPPWAFTQTVFKTASL